MNEQPTAFYEDLGIVPDGEFTNALRIRLQEQLSATRGQTIPMTTTEEVHEMTLATMPRETGTDPKHPRRRWTMIAAAAACVIAIAATVYVAGSEDDGAVITPADSVPTPDSIEESIAPAPSVPPTQGLPSTTIADDPEASQNSALAPDDVAFTDQQIAHAILLPLGEYHPDRAYPSFADASVAMDASIASPLPECTGFEMAFESPDRPARVAARMFQRTDEGSLQYVLVLQDESTAHAAYEILADPEFWAGCGVAYAGIEPGAGAGGADSSQLPRSISDTSEVFDPPQLEPSGDESTTLAVSNDLGPVYFSILRVGRAVVTLETAGQRDSEGTTVFTPAQIQAALDSVVSRAEGALARERSAATVDDAFLARSVVLDDRDFDIRDFEATASGPVRMDGDVAARLTPCEQFVDTVFESARRPAAVAYATFYSTSIPALMPNYVVVHPSEQQATAMLDGMQDPAFQTECVPAYNTTLPARPSDIEYWFPFFVGDELPAPEIDVEADDILVRRYTGTWTDDAGVVHGPEEFAYAAVRVGRIVASIEVELEDSNGAQVTSLEQFEEVVQMLAIRAAAAQ